MKYNTYFISVYKVQYALTTKNFWIYINKPNPVSPFSQIYAMIISNIRVSFTCQGGGVSKEKYSKTR